MGNSTRGIFETPEEKAIAAMPIRRDVDWRKDPVAIRSGHQLCAAMGQQTGHRASKNSLSCDH